jgi:16S rRNA (cytosine1402-N4)-methyltransferase
MSNKDFVHQSVLLQETLFYFTGMKMKYFVDGTLGAAGHASAILENNRDVFLIGMEVDRDMIIEAEKRLRPYKARCEIVAESYSRMEEVLESRGIKSIDGVLLDLGVSSLQLDTADRGFSFHREAPLDMRFDRTSPRTALAVVNEEPAEKIADIIRTFGEDRDAARLSQAIAEQRAIKPIETTLELEQIIRSVKGSRWEKRNPAARIFQAFRMFVNSELENLQKILPSALKLLREGGRMAVISFHSLEDRIVKNFLQDNARGCECPKELPYCACGKKPSVKILTKRPVVPKEEESACNPRSRSAKLRVAEKLGGERK